MASLVDKQRDIWRLFSHVGHPPRSQNSSDLQYENTKLKEKLGKISTSDSFQFFDSGDLGEAKKFCMILLAAESHEEFMDLAWDARNKMNKRMFVFGTAWALQDSPLYKGVYCPPIEEISPEYFIPFETIVEAVYQYHHTQEPLVIPVHPTGTLEDEEYKVAYFREDIRVNSHHWHWHLVYPSNGKTKDRKGELFYYMHQQMLARYDADRMAVGLKRVLPLRNFNDILMGYASHLALEHGKKPGSRPEGMYLKGAANMVRWRERILEAIHRGFLISEEGYQVPLNNETGIDLLAAVVEPSNDSVNRNYYGGLHNTLHTEISKIHDIQEKFKELPGVIGDISTAVRDPAFFRLHRFIDDVFTENKDQLAPYTKEELIFSDVEIKAVTVEGAGENVISTCMRKDTLRLNYAIPIFPPDQPVEVEFEHLDHDPFFYRIIVTNSSGKTKYSNVRIFLAPKFDENGQNWTLTGRRRHFIELDKFYWPLVPGDNEILRESIDSTVTLKKDSIPTAEKLRRTTDEDQFAHAYDDYCSCGWPHHLLIPRGTPKGMDFRLFVMLTDYYEDYVPPSDPLHNKKPGEVDPKPVCEGAVSYCGVKDSKYPDKRPMGFPFDRRIEVQNNNQIKETEDYVENAFKTPNMSFTDIKIQFKSKT